MKTRGEVLLPNNVYFSPSKQSLKYDKNYSYVKTIAYNLGEKDKNLPPK